MFAGFISSMIPKVAVIGSNSFSGSDFIDLLLEKGRFAVIGISRSPEKNAIFLPYKRHATNRFRFHQLDLNTQFHLMVRLLASFQPDYVVNFAGLIEVASSWEHPAAYIDTNTVCLSRLIAYLVNQPYLRRYMHISSAEVYGSCHNADEEAVLSPSSPYAVSKAAGDLLVLAYRKMNRFPAVIVRSTNVYGAHQQLFRLIPKSIIYIKKGLSIPLHGGGKAIKSYVHISDVSRGELAIMEHGRDGEIYHLSPGKGRSIRDVIRITCSMTDATFSDCVTIVPDRTGGQDGEYTINSAKSRKEFGWKPMIDFLEGIRDVLSWIDAYWSQIRHLSTTYHHRK